MITEKKNSTLPALLAPVTLALLLVGWQMQNEYTLNLAYFLVWVNCLCGAMAAIYIVWASLEWKKDKESKNAKAFIEIVEASEKANRSGLGKKKIKARPYIQWAIFLLLIVIGSFFTALCFFVFSIGGWWICKVGAKYPES